VVSYERVNKHSGSIQCGKHVDYLGTFSFTGRILIHGVYQAGLTTENKNQ